MEFHPNDLSDLDDLTEEHLGFSALSDGLGFSKGKNQLPHPATQKAPVKASELPSIDADFDEDPLPLKQPAPYLGAGATLAGPVRFAPQVAAKAPAKTAPAKATSVSTSTSTSILGPTPAAAAQVLAEPAAPRLLRLAAFSLDALFLLVPLTLGWFVSFGSASKEIFLQDPASPLGLFAVIFGAYFLLSESFGGQSLAKMILGLRVVEDDKYQKPTGFGHAAARLGLFLLSAVCFGIGLVASFWDAKRRPWHDRYSGSIVRRSA